MAVGAAVLTATLQGPQVRFSLDSCILRPSDTADTLLLWLDRHLMRDGVTIAGYRLNDAVALLDRLPGAEWPPVLRALAGCGQQYALDLSARSGGELVPFQQACTHADILCAFVDADRRFVRHADLTLFHQPIRALVGKGGYRTTVSALLRNAMTRSDNTANDVLLWRVGGPRAINAMLAAKRIAGVTFGPGERILQAKTVGLEWRPEWAGGWGFLQARAALRYDTRARALERYLAAPYDGASSDGVTLGLSLLARGKLLSARSTASLLTLMRSSKTGPLRLKSGLRPGWTLAHKTGTGQDLSKLGTGYNDIGLLVAFNGHRYGLAVMIASTRQPLSGCA